MAIKKMYGNLNEWTEAVYDQLPSTSTILVNTTGDDQGLIQALKIAGFKGEKGDRGYPGNVILPDGLVISSVGYTMLGQETEQEMREIINARAQNDDENSIFVTKGNIIRANVNKEDVVAGGDLRLVPVGGIIMWSGASTAVPSGWLLCDGTNGTPDLRDRFVVGAGNTYSVGSTGGVNEVTLTSAQSGLPAHGHPMSDPGHLHSFVDYYYSEAGGIFGGGEGSHSSDSDNGPKNNFTHNTNSSGSGISISNNTAQNAVSAHENRPPYYALAYIMFKGYN